MCHKIGATINNIKVYPILPHFQNGRNIFIIKKYYIRFGGDLILISQSNKNKSRCSGLPGKIYHYLDIPDIKAKYHLLADQEISGTIERISINNGHTASNKVIDTMKRFKKLQSGL